MDPVWQKKSINFILDHEILSLIVFDHFVGLARKGLIVMS